MDDTSPWPHRVTRLGRALRPVWQALDAHIDTPVPPVVAAAGMDGAVPYHVHALQATLNRLVDASNQMMTDVVANEHDGDAHIARAVACFVAGIDALQAGHWQLRSLNVPWPHTQVRDLLAGVYRHHLTEVHDWLGELLDAIEDPQAALQRRGLPAHGRVDLPLILAFTPAPQLHRLADWLEQRPDARGDAPGGEAQPAWWRKLGAFGIGWAIGHALFDDDCGGDGDG